ncbi:Bax inhibitor-1/YccA family protein [Agromyces archimandritae]|uniref:Bax inhibitor-1/YccA family protein n=1 Tax=Agromyces archimandritae TaxID=2781962 RepID=A0A975IMW5_9MICO|nr:Bax inhibitor-1/YccA family protein [Agromyces archimandritae]QTX03905.1 Bax inhibitor-1/YccA family protein [Agromyces archimandritae]
MAIDNPAFSRNDAFSKQRVATVSATDLQEMYDRPSAPEPVREVMTVEGTIQKSVISFGVMLVAAAIGWFTADMYLWVLGGIAGFVLALVNSFKKEPSPALILAYAGTQGLFVGGISALFGAVADGAVSQAVIATLVVFGVTLALFASGKIRASKKATKIFLIAMVGYAVFSLVNIVLMWTGVSTDPWGLRGGDFFGIPIALLLGVLVVIMAAYSLVLDFDFIKQGVDNKAPAKYQWTGAFGIMVTVVWLYVELLRMFAILQSND